MMNIWFQILAETPATLQRLIARSNRISLPRGASPEIRLERLRLSLCHARTVRVSYFAMTKDEQAAVQELRHIRGGLSPDELVRRFGPVRPWSQIACDITPHTLSERLILHGFLLPRPATYRHPARFLLPPEVRNWLPHPLHLHDFGAAPLPPLPPVLRAARTILLLCAERPLPLRQDGQLRLSSLRLLTSRLAPLDQAEVSALCHFVLPLLIDLGLLAPHGADAELAPNGARFLALAAEEQLARLCNAWIGVLRVEEWVRPHLVDTRGIDWPLLRRRLLIWAAALPVGRLLDPNALHDALTDAFGPLADANTHGWRRVERVPWWPKRAAAVWNAALGGPLRWLGAIAWAGDGTTEYCFATSFARAGLADTDDDAAGVEPNHAVAAPEEMMSSTSDAWRYGTPGEIVIPHAAQDAAVLRLLPYALWHSASAERTTYQISARRLATARRDGFSIDALVALLERQAGPLPEDWPAWLTPAPSLRIIYGAVVTSDEPSALDRAAQRRGVRRYLHHLAPGIALADPLRVETLSRALGRLDLAVEQRGAPEIARPAELSAAECAVLLAACDCYRQHAGIGVAPDSLAQLEQRLRAALPFEQRLAPGVSIPPQAHPSDITLLGVGPIITELPPLGRGGSPDAAVTSVPSDLPACETVRVASAAVQATAARTGLSPRRAPAAIGAALHALRLALILSVSVLLAGLWRRHLPKRQSSSVPAISPAPLEPPASVADPAAILPGQSPDVPNGALIATYLPILHQAIERRQPLEIGYQASEAPPSKRIIRPFRLENHGDYWYLHAYCTLRQAERVFRLDRITALRVVQLARRRGRPRREQQSEQSAAARPARSRSRPPQASFFAPPPVPPPGSPLVRVWLAD